MKSLLCLGLILILPLISWFSPASEVRASIPSDQSVYHTLSLGSGGQGSENSSQRHSLSMRYAVTFNVNRNLISPAFSILAQTGEGLFDLGGRPVSYDLGLLYGRRLTGSVGYLYAGAGVAYVHVTRWHTTFHYYSGEWSYEEHVTVIHRTIGIPWNVCAAWMPEESFGLLFQFFGDMNRWQSYYGWGVGLHFGG